MFRIANIASNSQNNLARFKVRLTINSFRYLTWNGNGGHHVSEPSSIVFGAPTANENSSFLPASPLPSENSMFSDSAENLTTPGEFDVAVRLRFSICISMRDAPSSTINFVFF